MSNWQDAEIVGGGWQDAEVVDPNAPIEPKKSKQPGIAELGLQHPVAQFTEGLITGAENFRSGFRQLIDAGGSLMGAEPMYPVEQEAIAERDQRMSELGIIGQAGAIAGETAPSMMVPGGPAGGLGRRIAGGIATDVASSVADPVREGQTRAGNLAFAGGVSTGMRGITAPFSIAANKLANAKTDDLRDQAAKDLIATADAEDIRIFFDDVSGNPLASKISGAAEFFRTLGTGKGRELQNVDAARAADRWLSRFAGNQDEYTDVIQKGLEKKLRIFQGAATKKYQRAINKMGNPDVTTSRFDGALDSGIQAELAKGGRANDEVISLLQNYQNSPRGNFETMIEFRSDFNKDVSNLAFGNNPPNKTAKDALRRASKAIDDDMAEVAKANGAIDEWRAANKFYQNNVIQFQKGKLKNLVNEDSAANFDAQSAWRYLSQANANPKRAQRMWQALDVKGRAAVRQGLIEEAVEAASREGKPFSPAMFSAYLEKRMPVVEQFFRGKSREEIKGLAKVMRHIQKSGQYMEDPPTGQRLVPWLVGGVGYISPDVAVAGVASALATKGAFQTRTGRNFLLAASHASEGSAQMNNIIEQMNKFVARSARSEEDEK